RDSTITCSPCNNVLVLPARRIMVGYIRWRASPMTTELRVYGYHTDNSVNSKEASIVRMIFYRHYWKVLNGRSCTYRVFHASNYMVSWRISIRAMEEVSRVIL